MIYNNRGMVTGAMIPLREAAERLGVHEDTGRNWIDRGVIVGVRLPTGTRRLPVAEVERLERKMFAIADVVRLGGRGAPKPVAGEVCPASGSPLSDPLDHAYEAFPELWGMSRRRSAGLRGDHDTGGSPPSSGR